MAHVLHAVQCGLALLRLLLGDGLTAGIVLRLGCFVCQLLLAGHLRRDELSGRLRRELHATLHRLEQFLLLRGQAVKVLAGLHVDRIKVKAHASLREFHGGDIVSNVLRNRSVSIRIG